jgi:hypothetical protein
LSSSKRFSRVHNKIDDNNWDNRIRCLFISPQRKLCKKKRRPKSGVPEEQVLPPDKKTSCDHMGRQKGRRVCLACV